MKRALAVLLLLAAPAAAQVVYVPGGGGGGAFSGGAITAPILGATGCTTPPYSFTADTGAGLCLNAAANEPTLQDADAAAALRNAVGTSTAAGSVAYMLHTGGGVNTTFNTGDSFFTAVIGTTVKHYINTAGAKVASDGLYKWSSTTQADGSADTGMYRSFAGTVSINGGAAASGGTVHLDSVNNAVKFGTALDLGIVRNAAGVLKISDGGSGYGGLTLKDGASATPAILFAGAMQMHATASPALFIGTAAAGYMSLSNGATQIGQTFHFCWSSVSVYASGCDTGLARYSAGVIRATNAGTAINALLGGGAAVASAAALPLPTGNVFHVTGTTTITSITSTNFASGVVITLIFDGVLNFTDGSNLKLASTMATTADDTITLAYDGTNWYEIARSVN